MRSLLAAVVLGLAAAPASSQIVRVSVSTAGAEANGRSGPPSLSGSGRYVVFASTATNLVAGDTNGVSDVFLRDRDTDADGVFDEAGAVATTRLSVAAGGVQADGASLEPAITPDGRYVAFVSRADNLAAGGSGGFAQVYRLDRTSGELVRLSHGDAGGPALAHAREPAIADDGNVVVYLLASVVDANRAAGYRVVMRDVTANRTVTLSGDPPGTTGYLRPTISDDATRVGYVAYSLHSNARTGIVVETSSGASQAVSEPQQALTMTMALSASGTRVVVRKERYLYRRVLETGAETPTLPVSSGTPIAQPISPSARYILTEGGWLHDFELATSAALGFEPDGGDFSDDDRFLAVASASSGLVADDGNGVADVFVLELAHVLDRDNDTMDDRWEDLFAEYDPDSDPDGDGLTTAQEEDAGTHPNGLVRRFLAEGATGSFFRTTVTLANPDARFFATAVLTFDRGDGTRVRRPVRVPAGRSVFVNVGAVTGLEFGDFSTSVESDRFLGVERSITWGPSADVFYGSHAESATAAAAPTWLLAEGTTVVGFDLFYLLQNPQATSTHTTVRFLLPSGMTITRTYDLAPGSRTTIYVNQIAGLEETDVAGDISADAPIVVERAMYRSSAAQPFALGTETMGVTAPAASWFFAEGATGTFFDLYVLIANPGDADATVRADYARPDGRVVTRTYTVRAHSRYSVYVDSIAGLTDTSVATTLTSTNGVPIVAERSMYWPGGFFDYYEGHSSAGSTTTALSWVVAWGDTYGRASAQTFVLIANTESQAGEATITLLPDVGYNASPPPPRVVPLPARSRTTVPIVGVGGRVGALVQSTGIEPVRLVVESAVYHSADGVLWSAGSNALATPIP